MLEKGSQRLRSKGLRACARSTMSTERADLAYLIAKAVCETLSIRDARLITSITEAVSTHDTQRTANHDKGIVYAKTPQLNIPKIDDPKSMNIETRIRNFIRYRDDLLLYFTAQSDDHKYRQDIQDVADGQESRQSREDTIARGIDRAAKGCRS